jgi:hypothetical protein
MVISRFGSRTSAKIVNAFFDAYLANGAPFGETIKGVKNVVIAEYRNDEKLLFCRTL